MSSKNRIFSLGLGVLVILGLLISAPPAWSDWDPGDPYKMHYPQLPDLDNGIDVAHTADLADDFLCTGSGPITDIHIWTSRVGDVFWEIPFVLEIWSNNPGEPNGFSFPQEKLWGKAFQPTDYT